MREYYWIGSGGCHQWGVSLNSISVTHFTHSKPRLPGATSLSRVAVSVR